jgi:hypothetical protein
VHLRSCGFYFLTYLILFFMKAKILIYFISLFLAFCCEISFSQTGSLPLQRGMAALTCFSTDRDLSSDPNGYVLAIFDIRGPNCDGISAPAAPSNWTGPTTGAYHHSSWTAQNLGEIFGIDLQRGSATPDIFVTSGGLSSYYRMSTQLAPGGTGGDVFRINGTTGVITKLASLPNTTYDPLPANTGQYSKYVGLGNVSHNNVNNVLYVTNLDNGLMYVLNATTGATLGTYDHLPGTPDDPNRIFTTNLRQVYGVSYNSVDNKVYYAVPTIEANCSGNSYYVTQNSIYSVGLNADGTINASSKTLVVHIPILTSSNTCSSGRAYYPVISDIEFNSEGTQMLIAERTLADRDTPLNNPTKPTDLEVYAHESRVMKYNLSGSTWSQSVVYSVGNYNNRLTNSTGGVDFGYNNYGTCGEANACNDAMVGLADALIFNNIIPPYKFVYGILISNISGNASGYPGNSYFVDVDNLVDDWPALEA